MFVSFGRHPDSRRDKSTQEYFCQTCCYTNAKWTIQLVSFPYPVLKLGKKGNNNDLRQAKGWFCILVLHKSITTLAFENWEGMDTFVLTVPLSLEMGRGIQSKPPAALASARYKEKKISKMGIHSNVLEITVRMLSDC